MDVDTSAAILAGGQARRLGGIDKCRLVVGGRPIIVRQIDILQQVARDVFIVAPDPARFSDLPLPVQVDRVPGAGALGGIYTALAAAPPGRVLVVACDLPFLHAGLLEALADRAADVDGAWVRTPRGVEPLLACYHTHAASIVRGEIDAGRLKARDLGAVLRMAEIGPDELERFGSIDELAANVNTPDDFARVQYRPR
jgi:molybdopterin-guanine dinucleotide biosynthesis protein A